MNFPAFNKKTITVIIAALFLINSTQLVAVTKPAPAPWYTRLKSFFGMKLTLREKIALQGGTERVEPSKVSPTTPNSTTPSNQSTQNTPLPASEQNYEPDLNVLLHTLKKNDNFDIAKIAKIIEFSGKTLQNFINQYTQFIKYNNSKSNKEYDLAASHATEVAMLTHVAFSNKIDITPFTNPPIFTPTIRKPAIPPARPAAPAVTAPPRPAKGPAVTPEQAALLKAQNNLAAKNASNPAPTLQATLAQEAAKAAQTRMVQAQAAQEATIKAGQAAQTRRDIKPLGVTTTTTHGVPVTRI